ncbi:MAG: hypothetical protein RL477_1326 [Pseudomonadota bacterium]|jgi:hypothetical protein
MVAPVASRLASRIVYGLFAAALLVIAAVTAMWFAGAAEVRQQIAAIGRNAVGADGQFTVGTLDVTGFPFAYEARLGDIALNGRDARGTWEWRAEKATVTLSPWLGRAASFDLAGQHRLRFRLGRLPLDMEITAARAPGEVQFGSASAPALYKLSPEGVRIHEISTNADIKAEKGAFQLFLYPPGERKTANTQPVAGLLVELSGIDLPPAMGRFLAPRLAKLAAEVQVLGLLPAPVDRRNMARFREAGGSIEVRNLALHWGPARIDGSGTMTLDAGLQPEASFAARMTGFEETADALVAAGLIRAQEAQGVKLLLSLMARRSDPGRGAEIRVPITIQDRSIYVGPARLARLPQVRW